MVLQNGQMYSGSVQSAVLGLNRTIATDPAALEEFHWLSEHLHDGVLVPGLGRALAGPAGLPAEFRAWTATGASGHPLTPQQSWDLASQLVANASAVVVLDVSPLHRQRETAGFPPRLFQLRDQLLSGAGRHPRRHLERHLLPNIRSPCLAP